MNKYEAMFIVKPDLPEEERKTLFNFIHDSITKNQGNVLEGSVWQERRKFFFPIKKHLEGLYYLVNFTIAPKAIKEIRHAYNLNESILRVLVTRQTR
jgi:small subunit ribosomal protein S6